jgi:FkbH-like protein
MKLLSSQEIEYRRERGIALELQESQQTLSKKKIAVLSTFEIRLIKPYLQEALERIGFYGTVYISGFGQLFQEILDPASTFYQSEPEEIIIIPAVEDCLLPLFSSPTKLLPEDIQSLIDESIAELENAITILLARLPKANCYLVTFGSLQTPLGHLLNSQISARGQIGIEFWLKSIRELGNLSRRIIIADWDWHSQALGKLAFFDERLWYVGRMRLNPLGLATLADFISCYIAANYNLTRKALIVDLDNTIWGGVVGEVGLKGLVLGEEGSGLAFQDVQRELLKLHDIGVVLALCSKNNPDDVWEVFDHHPGMVLKREHFAAVRINWQDKASNVLALSEELRLGLDSLVLLDDSPVEQEWIRMALPAVLVLDLPHEIAYRPRFLRDLPYFLRLTLTNEDLLRAITYKNRPKRLQMREHFFTLEDFLISLEQEIIIQRVQENTLTRAAQICQRTNQFNLTTHRYTIADIEQMMEDTSKEVYILAVQDRFGDNGVTGLCILHLEGLNAHIDTFLLSCRVLGRKIEDAFLLFVADRARMRGAHFLIGQYKPTAKNEQTANFYINHNFEAIGDGYFRFDLEKQELDRSVLKIMRVVTHA